MAEISKEALVDNMIELLKAFNNEGAELNEETVHSSVLAGDDGYNAATSSKKLYSGGLQWIVWRNSGTKVKLPSGWMDQTVGEVADYIISKLENQ